MKIYAGIGNRIIDVSTENMLWPIASAMAQLGWRLRSGGANGADYAFYKGAKIGKGKSTIFRPKSDIPKKAFVIAEKYHPAWHRCDDYTKRLLARNVQIILGKKLTRPVDFVFAYTKDEEHGGTAHAIRVARAHKITVVNLYNPERFIGRDNRVGE